MIWPPSASMSGWYSCSGSMMMMSSSGRDKNVLVISNFAACDLPEPVVPRMNPLPLTFVVRFNTTASPLRAFAPYQ